MNLSRTIKDFKKELAINSQETFLQSIIRKQRNLLWWYSRTGVTKEDAYDFAKRNSGTDEQCEDNKQIFARLFDERTNGRKLIQIHIFQHRR
jgi:hypothetical protein